MGKAQDARDAASQDEIDEIETSLQGFGQAIATNDGREADERPITDRDIELHVSGELADNYAAVTAEQHGGDWGKLADQFDRSADAESDAGRTANVRGHRVLAAWARRRAAEGDTTVEASSKTAPKGRTAPGKSTT